MADVGDDFSTKAALLTSAAKEASHGEINFAKAVQIAKKTDTAVNHYSEYKNGYFFINRSEMEDISDPGFAVAKKDGKVYCGFAAHEFLDGDMVGEGDF